MASTKFARQISPKPIRSAAMLKVFAAEQKLIGQEMKKDFEATIATFKKLRPRFFYQYKFKGGRSLVSVGLRQIKSKAEINYARLNDGTRPHRILPGILTGKSKKKALFFSKTFKAKTSPGFIGSREGGSGKRDTLARGVNHPGTKPRRWDRAISKKWAPIHYNRLRAAMTRAIAASGHAI